MKSPFLNNPGHKTTMAAMHIYAKNLSKIFFSGNAQPIATKLDMLQLELKYYNLFISHNPVITLTNFTARST